MKKTILKAVADMAKKSGQKTVDSACFGWLCQPKVPTSMKEQIKK